MSSSKKHKKIHLDKNPYQCEICREEFVWINDLKNHMNRHTAEKRFECNICKKKFSDHCSMKSHLMTYTRNGLPFKCPVCPKDFLRFSDLKEHMRIHPEFKPFECQICKERFSKNCDLSTHMLVHEKSLVTSSDFRSDKKPFNKNKQYVCNICGQKFLDKYCKNLHTRNHNGERVIDCDFCKRKFTTKGYLSRHMIIHSKLKAEYSCQVCQQSFIRVVNLKRHMGECHTGEKSINQALLICEKQKADSIQKIQIKNEVEDTKNKGSEVLEEMSFKNTNESENDILLSVENAPCEQPLDLSNKMEFEDVKIQIEE